MIISRVISRVRRGTSTESFYSRELRMLPVYGANRTHHTRTRIPVDSGRSIHVRVLPSFFPCRWKHDSRHGPIDVPPLFFSPVNHYSMRREVSLCRGTSRYIHDVLVRVGGPVQYGVCSCIALYRALAAAGQPCRLSQELGLSPSSLGSAGNEQRASSIISFEMIAMFPMLEVSPRATIQQ